MKPTRIPVDLGDRKYDVVVGAGILARLGEWITPMAKGRKVGLVVHPRVYRLYGEGVIETLRKMGSDPLTIFVPEGERHKTVSHVERIYDRLVTNRFERSSLLVALGGGVIGDMVGFTAATFLRGISYIQCPTTVIAQVDAAIGGKTGVDHPKGKNLIGAFYHPLGVYADLSVLASLSQREFVAGFAEVIKYGVIYDARFFDFIERNAEAILRRDMKALTTCVQRSIEIKVAVVSGDERESGLRKILNYGHTVGHALETLAGYRRKHGEAIAIGMMAAASIAERLGIGSADVTLRQERLFKVFGLPTRLPRVDPSKLIRLLYSDKKVVGGEVHFVLPEKIGAVFVRKVKRTSLTAILKEICLN